MQIDTDSEIVRHDDGTLTVTVAPDRQPADEDGDDGAAGGDAGPSVVTLSPGEGGYDEALAAWDLQHNPEAAVSTASGREQARSAVHAVATDEARSESDAVEHAVEDLDDPEAGAEALRHVLVGGQPSVEGFAAEVAESEGDEPIPAHRMTKIIGEVIAEVDS